MSDGDDVAARLRAVCDKAEPMRPAMAECGYPEGGAACRRLAGHALGHSTMHPPPLGPSQLCVPVQDVLAVLDGHMALLGAAVSPGPQLGGSQSGNDPLPVDPGSYHAGYQAGTADATAAGQPVDGDTGCPAVHPDLDVPCGLGLGDHQHTATVRWEDPASTASDILRERGPR